MADLLKVTIDGREAMVPKGTLIVEAAKQVGVDIPVFCYHEKLAPAGACRMCLVEIEKMPRLQTACTTPVTDGMVVRTDTPAVDKARKGVLEFILTNHPLDCPVCDKGGECPLQDTTFRYACDRSRFEEEKRHFQKPVRLSDNIVLDRERCIMCMRCVRFQREVAGDESLTLLNRGARSEVGTLPGRRFDSVFSGNTTELCPVGALTSARFRFRARSWELTKTPSICVLCPVGCNVKVETRNGEVMRLTSRENPDVDGGWLCDWGRFTYDFVNDPARLSTPLVRRNGELVPATWREALEAVARGLEEAASDGGQAVGGLISPSATNEELYLFQKLFRSVLKSNNVDHGVHGRYSLPERGEDAPTASIAALESADVIVLAGVDPLARQPVLDLRLKKAAKRGAKLLVIGPERTDLARRGVWLKAQPDSEAAVVKGILRELLSERMEVEVARGRLGGSLETVTANVAEYSPDLVRDVAACDPAMVESAAELLSGTTKVAVLYPRPMPGGPEGLREACEWLAAATGGLNDPAGGVLPLSTAANAQGALDLGILPNLLPGQVRLGEAAGLNGAEMIDAAAGGRLKALFVVGLDPAGTDDAAARALSRAGFLVAQDIFLTATAKLADVVLPGAAFSEKDGTLTNMEGRVQRLNAAVSCRGGARPDWEILVAIGRALGGGSDWSGLSDASDVFDEICRVVPRYRGLSHEVLGDHGRRAGAPAGAESPESPSGRERRLWYVPRPLEAEPQVAGS